MKRHEGRNVFGTQTLFPIRDPLPVLLTLTKHLTSLSFRSKTKYVIISKEWVVSLAGVQRQHCQTLSSAEGADSAHEGRWRFCPGPVRSSAGTTGVVMATFGLCSPTQFKKKKNQFRKR